MSSIFISYRRADTGGHAGRLFDRLRHWFDAEALFYDVDGIDSGDVFPARLDDAIRNAQVVLVVIGPDWLSSLNERAPRSGVDYVRREVELALTCNAQHGRPRLIPVLVGGASAPDRDVFCPELRSKLGAIATLDAHEFRGKQDDWDNQFVRLRNLLAQIPSVPAPRSRAPTGTEQPFHVIEHSLSAHFQDPNALLGRLRANLEHGAAAVVARAALFGMGGVGKTQLALKYSHEYRDAYAGVWWFRAEAEGTLQLDAHDCCVQVSAPIRKGELPSTALKRWLATQPATWLLVYDNAEETAALRPHLPEGDRHHTMITSRNPAWGGLAKPVELEVWAPEQAAQFLGQRLPVAAHADLLALSEDLGGLPLALDQAASYIEETGTTVAAYRALLAGTETGELTLDEGRAATGYERSVAATLSLAFARLSPAAAQLLRLCAYAAPEPLPERFFVEAREALPTELAAAAATPLNWNRVVGELRRFGLAQRVSIAALDRMPGEMTDSTEQALSLHRLTQQISRARLALPQEDYKAFASVLKSACPPDPELPANWPRLAALSEHVTQLDRFVDAGWVDTRSFTWLLSTVARYFERAPARLSESVRWFGRALEINRAELGEEHPETLSFMNNLAETIRAQGDLAGARSLQERVVEVALRVLGEDDPRTLTSLANLAITLGEEGDHPGARILNERVLELRRRVLGEEHPDTLTSMNNLAETLRAQGELPDARILQERVLEVRCRVLGETHPDTVRAMNNLASTLEAQDDLHRAHALRARARELWRGVLGDEHPDTLTSVHNLAITLWRLGEREAAVEYMQHAAEGRRRLLGAQHPHTQESAVDLARMRGSLNWSR